MFSRTGAKRNSLRPFCDEVTFQEIPKIMKIEFPTFSRDQISRYGGQKVARHLSVPFGNKKHPKRPYGTHFVCLRSGVGVRFATPPKVFI